jgi:hypothetical protein
MRVRFIRVAVCALTLGCTVACGDAFSPNATVAGTWVLTAVDGKPLPYPAGHGHGSVTVLADTLTLRPDGTALSASSRWVIFNHPSFPPVNEPARAHSTGAWTQEGGAVRITWATGTRTQPQRARHAGRGRLVADSLLSGAEQPQDSFASPTRWEWARAR